MGFSESQLEAINHSGSDLIISAAAGSGKTFTLVSRVIKKIKGGVEAEIAKREGRPKDEIARLQHGSDISRMLIVTFTNPAASELKSEICDAIATERKLNPTSAHLESQYIKSSYADISTIDSFCMRLVRPNFDKLPFSLDANFRIGEAGELKILNEQTMEELIDELYESHSDNSDFLLVANCYSKFRNEQELAKSLLDLRKKLVSTKDGIKTLLNCESYENDFLKTPYGKVLCEHILEITTHFIPIYKHFIGLLEYDAIGADEFVPTLKKDLEYLEAIDTCVKAEKPYDDLSAIVNSYELDALSKKKYAQNKEISISNLRLARNDLASTINKLKKFFVANEDAVISSIKQNARMCRAIYNILSLFEQKLLAKKRLLSVYSFDDISKFALLLLYDENGNRTKLANEIASRYDDIYIDEYQDTNSVQDKIFEAISSNNRFMVGDIKQSIYRFRSAEPEIFKSYRNRYKTKELFDENSPGKAIFMSNNYRCDENVVELSNMVSNYMFEGSYGVPYSKEDRLIFSKDIKDKTSYTERVSEVHIINSKGQGKNPIAYQAKYVALQIRDLIGQDMPNPKYDSSLPENEKNQKRIKIKASDITILLRNANSQIPYYVDALGELGIPSMYKVKENFFETPHIMLVLCILNAIDNPSKDIYLAGAMRSPVFNFSLEELVRIKRKIKGGASLYSTLKSYNVDDALKEKINDFLKVLKEHKISIKKKSSHNALSYIYNECGLLTMCKDNERADLMKLYNIARVFEGTSFKGVFSFLKHIDNLSRDYESREFQGDITKDSVQLMSIHASKGLQFPVCFVCGAENTFNSSDTNGELLFHRELGVAGFVGKDDGLARFDTLARKCIALKIQKESVEEEMRILYVALTRAKHQLVITGCSSNPKKARGDILALSDFTTPYTLYNTNSFMKFILGALKEESNKYYSIFLDTVVNSISDDGASGDEDMRVEIDGYKKIFDERFAFKYKYDYLERIPSKLSVSSLSSKVLDEKNSEIKIPELDSTPRFLLNDKELEESITGAQRGTATHVFLQFCDFNRLLENGVDAELKQLVDDKFISESDSLLVDKDNIEKFIKSRLLKQILSAKEVHREFRFNILLDANDFTSKKDLDNEKILVQGVMDCILELDDGRLVLIDYKTDKVTPDNYKKELSRRYSSQLKYYKLACEKIFDKEVFEVKLYSVLIGDDFVLEIK